MEAGLLRRPRPSRTGSIQSLLQIAHTVAQRLGFSHADAEDLAQAAVRALLRRSGEPPVAPEEWVRFVTKRMSNAGRRNGPREVPLDPPPSVGSSESVGEAVPADVRYEESSGQVAVWLGPLLPKLERFAKRTSPASSRRRYDPEDLVQDACCKALARGDASFDNPPALASFLCTCIRNQVRDELRRSQIGETQLLTPAQEASSEPSQFVNAAESESRRRILRGLCSLPRQEQELLVGRLLFAASDDELSTLHCRSAEGARRALRRAMAHLILFLEMS